MGKLRLMSTDPPLCTRVVEDLEVNNRKKKDYKDVKSSSLSYRD